MGCEAIGAQYVQQGLEDRDAVGGNEHLHALIAGQGQERFQEGTDGRMVKAVLQLSRAASLRTIRSPITAPS